MGKLLERLRDPSRNGVYRVRRADEVLDALSGSSLCVSRVGAPSKQALLEALAEALDFPAWFGGNWDALEDCLCDLSWRPAEGYVLLFDEVPAGDDGRTLLEVLADAAGFWRAAGKPFFAVVVDAGRSVALPELFRES